MMMSKNGANTIICKYDNPKNINATLKNSEDTPINLTWATIYFTVNKTDDVDDIDTTGEKELLKKEITDITPLEWKFTLTLSPADTKTIGLWNFSYDFKVVWDENTKYTTPIGILTISNVVNQI